MSCRPLDVESFRNRARLPKGITRRKRAGYDESKKVSRTLLIPDRKWQTGSDIRSLAASQWPLPSARRRSIVFFHEGFDISDRLAESLPTPVCEGRVESEGQLACQVSGGFLGGPAVSANFRKIAMVHLGRVLGGTAADDHAAGVDFHERLRQQRRGVI